MLQGEPLEHSAILLTFIELPFVIKIIVLYIFEWSFYTGFTVCSLLAARVQGFPCNAIHLKYFQVKIRVHKRIHVQ